MRLIVLLMALGLSSCAATEPNWCHRWHPVYMHGRRCASGKPVPDYGDDVVYVDDCSQCFEGNSRTGGTLDPNSSGPPKAKPEPAQQHEYPAD